MLAHERSASVNDVDYAYAESGPDKLACSPPVTPLEQHHEACSRSHHSRLYSSPSPSPSLLPSWVSMLGSTIWSATHSPSYRLPSGHSITPWPCRLSSYHSPGQAMIVSLHESD